MGRKPKAAKLDDETVPRKMTQNSNHSCEANPNPNIQAKITGLLSKSKAPKHRSTIIRRSERLHHLTPYRNKEIQTVIEEIDLIDSEKEDQPESEEEDQPESEEEDQPHGEQNSTEPITDHRSLEEKVDYLLRTVEELISKATKRNLSSENAIDLKYRSLYFESQKKIEALTDENNQLGKKLEIASEKLEAYEKGIHVCTDLIEKLKEVILVSNLTKATEKVLNLSSQAIHGGVSSPDAAAEPRSKRLKGAAKESKKN